jgi:hypothetical protein
MAHVAWSRDRRLAVWTSLGRDLVDPTRPVLGEVIKPFRCCQRQTQNCQPQNNADLQDLSHARAPQLAIVMMTRGHQGGDGENSS